jgi:hypothetical protein
LFVEALLFNGKPPILAVLVLVLPRLEAVLGADVVDDGPMTICEMGTVVVAETGDVAESVAVFGVLWGVPALVLIVTDGRPADEHVVSNAGNENA